MFHSDPFSSENQSHPLDTIPEAETPSVKLSSPEESEKAFQMPDKDSKFDAENNNNTAIDVPEIKVELTEPELVGSKPKVSDLISTNSRDEVDASQVKGIIHSGKDDKRVNDGRMVKENDEKESKAKKKLERVDVKRAAYKRSFSEGDYLKHNTREHENLLSLRHKDRETASQTATSDLSNERMPLDLSGSSEDLGQLNRSYSSGDGPEGLNKSTESAESRDFLLEKHIQDSKQKLGSTEIQQKSKDVEVLSSEQKESSTNKMEETVEKNAQVVKEDVVKFTAKVSQLSIFYFALLMNALCFT